MVTIAALLFPLFGLLALAVCLFTLREEWHLALGISQRATGITTLGPVRVTFAPTSGRRRAPAC